MTHKERHVAHIRIDPGWGASLSFECPYAPADTSRPCWPHNETGERYPDAEGANSGCVYVDYADLENVIGSVRVLRFALEETTWDDPFDPRFALGDFLGEVRA